ncbi:MAG TPA: hypothetical protein VD927_11695 [Chryseosolibacter sp.]|nr:hypothetical protein [Chryseosolibacter sp.]
MPFSYKIINPDRIVFKRESAGCGRLMFVFVGSVFILVGLGLFLFSEKEDFLMKVMTFMFPTFGLIAVVSGLKLPDIQARTIPDEIIFDNAKGRVQINQQVSEIKTAYIYYDEIQDFMIKVKKHETSSSGGGSSRTYYRYHVYLQKKDGGTWELLKRNKEEDAKAEIEKIKSSVRLSQIPVRENTSITLSQKYKLLDYGTKAELTWRNPVGYGPLFLICFVTVFLTVLFAIFEGANFSDFGFFGYFIVGFILVVFVIVIGGNVIKMIKNFRTEYAISISDMSLNYIERDRAGRTKKDVYVSMHDLYALSFSFDTDEMMRKIYIYTREQFEKLNTMEVSLSVESIREIFNFHSELVSIEIQSLTPVETLHLENFLQQKIKEKSRANVA